jgi:hypothetical protein
MILPGFDVKEVEVVPLACRLVDKTSATFRQENIRSTQGKVDLRGQHTRTEQNFVTITEWAEYINAVLRHTSIDDTGKQIRSSINCMASDDTSKAVSYHRSSSVATRQVRTVALKRVQKVDKLSTEKVRTQPPIIAIIVNSKLIWTRS